MTISITIPVWLLWVIGTSCGLLDLGFAILGIVMLVKFTFKFFVNRKSCGV
jgi:hypothetical protein